MYSKANFQAEKNLVIPENYRGNAFSGQIAAEENVEPTEEDTQDTNEIQKDVYEAPQSESEPAADTKQNSFLASLMPPRVSNPSGILNNIGLEEMLIVGVLILLSQSNTDDDILLLLFLLLFYK